MLRYLGVLKSRSSPAKSERADNPSRRIFPFSLRITREGILYIASALFLSLTAVHTGNNLLYIIVATMLSSIAVSGIVSRNSLKQISLSLQLPENVFAGDHVSIKVSMKNMKRVFPSFSIRVEDSDRIRGLVPLKLIHRLRRRGEDTENEPENRAMFRQSAYFPVLRAGETRSEYTVQTFPRRGLYRLQGFWISTRFPFGFFRRGQLVGAKGEVLVYPLIKNLSSFYHQLPFLSGRLESLHAGQGENLFAMRKYQEGENARIIDWKATAKTGEWMAREYAREEEGKFCLILDTRSYAVVRDRSDSGFEKAVSLAASLTAHFLEKGASMAFLTPREWVPQGTGLDQRNRILRLLAVIEREASLSGTDAGLWDADRLRGIADSQAHPQIFSDKIFKIILTSRPRGSFPSTVWRSSRVIFFDEL